jgi:hypothetical protein
MQMIPPRRKGDFKYKLYQQNQAADVTLLPLESPLNTRVFGADFEGVGYVYLTPDFRG